MEHTKDTILISKQNLKTYGFACFHEKSQAVLKDNFWIREVELAIGPGEQRNVQKFKIQVNLLVEISHVDKIIQSEYYTINSNVFTIGAIQLLAERAGWNQTRSDLEVSHARLPTRQGNEGVRMATYYFQNQNIPLGSGITLPVSDELSWIGMILVHPELRRQGIARSIMNSCLEHARIIQKKAIVGLDATP
ncbi:MAG: GNAT family N-acetyltransferase, partial [Cyclobacteriaceae bacterium]|nr:GNAT family N-acetyltransferase [Cyclobacteriaceae bacterium]